VDVVRVVAGLGVTVVPTRIVLVLPSMTRVDIGAAELLTPLIDIALEMGSLTTD